MSKNRLVGAHQAALELAAFDESTLQIEIIEPLLSALRYTHVQRTGGPNEKGKDLVAIRTDEWGRPELVAIQIKRFKPTGTVASQKSWGGVLSQLQQALQEDVLDPLTNTPRTPDLCLFITPYPISPTVRALFWKRSQALQLKAVRIIDGIHLVELIRRHVPAALEMLSDDVQYRLVVADDVNEIAESKSAFDLGDTLKLDDLYVDVGLDYDDSLIESLLGAPIARTERLRGVAKTDVKTYTAAFKKACGVDVAITTHGKDTSMLVDVEIHSVVSPIRQLVQVQLTALAGLTDPAASEAHCTAVVSSAIAMRKKLDRLKELAPLSEICERLRRSSDAEPLHITLPSSVLLKVARPLLIRGGPGAGKTTLLRRLAQDVARDNSERLPIFVPLVSVEEPSYEGLVQGAMLQLRKSGYPLPDRATFIERATAGAFTMCFDGLDETGSRLEAILKAVDRFAQAHSSCRTILSCRDTFEVPSWTDAFAIHLKPFSDLQLNQFIAKWFKGSVSGSRLSQWLCEHPAMKDVARTPLIAALLCSLCHVDADLPATELDLYERRFELLLGKWDSAKGLPRLAANKRTRYLRFLAGLAIYMHSREKRTVSIEEALGLARKYFIPAQHRVPEGLIEDCVRRGTLERDSAGVLSLGHLTYQEYLASEWLAGREGGAAFIWSRLLTPWWSKASEFYAGKTQDLDPVVRVGLKYRANRESRARLEELARFAPLTTSQLLQKLRDLSPSNDAPAYRWDQLPELPEPL